VCVQIECHFINKIIIIIITSLKKLTMDRYLKVFFKIKYLRHFVMSTGMNLYILNYNAINK
jgi:hypothetical protein